MSDENAPDPFEDIEPDYSSMSIMEQISLLPPEEQEAALEGLDPEAVKWDWSLWSRPQQVPPKDESWDVGLALAGRGFGKRYTLDTLILSRNQVTGEVAFRRNGDLREGDTIFDERGRETAIVQAHAPGMPEKMYRFHFSDGTHLDSDAEHQWVTWTHADRKSFNRQDSERQKVKNDTTLGYPEDWPNWTRYDRWGTSTGIGPKVRTTQEIVDTFYYGKRGDRNHSIPVAGILQLPTASLTIPPYLLGLWLGDGIAATSEICGEKSDLGTYQTALVGALDRYATSPTRDVSNRPTFGMWTVGGLVQDLKAEGLFNNKHIPAEYLYASPEQRWELLAGLLDTDGSIHEKSGHIEFVNTNKDIAEGVLFLARSFGQTPTWTEKKTHATVTHEDGTVTRTPGKLAYRITWRPTMQFFKLPRKAERFKPLGSQALRNFHRMLVSYEEIEPTLSRCLTVDSPNSMYLAGEALIPTHNTRMASEWIRERARDESQGQLRFLLVARTAADVREVIVEGEALALDTLVASPMSHNGFIEIGKLKKGDTVVGGDGKPCKVKRVFEVLHGRPCYAVKIAGHPTPIIADANHKWQVRQRAGHWGTGRVNKRKLVMTTEEILADLDRRYYIEPVVLEGEDDLLLPYTPYNVGKILGTQPKSSEYTDHTASTRRIPEDYFWATPEIRQQVLQGLVDARAALGEGNEIPGTSTAQIRKDIRRLAAGLGYYTSEYWRSGPFGSWASTRFSRKGALRAIESITPVESVPVRCIEVDSPDHTFLVTESYIKTHNSGIIAVSPESEKPHYQPSIRRLTWPNGNQAFCTSADEPDSLRGVQAHYSWGDEIAAWRQPTKEGELSAWENLRIATRLGRNPQILATTTPKRVPVLFDLLEEKKKNDRIWVTRGSTFDNAGNLAGAYLDAITGVYGGTALAMQELYGNMLEAVEGALWTEEMINGSRTLELPPLTPMRVIGVDPTVAEEPGDECGIVVVASTAERDLYKRQAWVLQDTSVQGSPQVWANKVVEMHYRWGAPVVAETNQGGALVKNAIHQIDPNIPVYEVHSKVGKKLRAEPVTLAYQQGRVHHVGKTMLELEEQMITWEPENSRKSPDRIDALVHALTALLILPPKGLNGGPIRAKGIHDRSINVGGIRNRTPRTGPRASGFGGFRIGR